MNIEQGDQGYEKSDKKIDFVGQKRSEAERSDAEHNDKTLSDVRFRAIIPLPSTEYNRFICPHMWISVHNTYILWYI